MSSLNVDTINEKTTGNGVYIPGHVLQVKQDIFTGTKTTTSQSYVDTGLEISITPTSASSKIYIASVVHLSWDQGAAKVAMSLFRDNTEIFIGDANGNRQRVTSYSYWDSGNYSGLPIATSYIDSPSTTSLVTYSIKYKRMDPQGTVAVNRSIDAWSDSTIYGTQASSIVVMEIGG